MVSLIPLAKPLLGEEEKKAVLEVLQSGLLAQGKKVAEFEQAFAKFIEVKHAIATSNGTTALHAALLAHDIGPGDEVITTPFTFIATANAIRMCGATPVFVDIDEKTFNINPNLIEAAITSRTKALLPVHLFGQSCEMGQMVEIAQRYHLEIIEDCCQSHGAESQGKKVGSFGTGCFSFYPTKNMTTGEGGMITTNNPALAAKIRRIINHGSEKKYHHDFVGFNYRLTDIAAAIGLAQLQKLSLFTSKRQQHARYLTEKLAGLSSCTLPQVSSSHVFHQYTIRHPQRDLLQQHLHARSIDSAIFYPIPIHKQKAYQQFQHLQLPVAEKVSKEVLSLPIHPSLTTEELDNIIQALHNFHG